MTELVWKKIEKMMPDGSRVTLYPLKPCPHYVDGDKHILDVYPTGYGHVDWWQVECSCGATGPRDLGKSGAIEAWNTRPLEDKLLEACKEVEWVPLAVEDTYYCPWCGAFNIDGDTHGEHKPTCTRQAAIRAAEGVR